MRTPDHHEVHWCAGFSRAGSDATARLSALLTSAKALALGWCDPERDACELALGGYPWSRAEVMGLPVDVRRQHVEWCREHVKAQTAQWNAAMGGK